MLVRFKHTFHEIEEQKAPPAANVNDMLEVLGFTLGRPEKGNFGRKTQVVHKLLIVIPQVLAGANKPVGGK